MPSQSSYTVYAISFAYFSNLSHDSVHNTLIATSWLITALNQTSTDGVARPSPNRRE